MKYPSPFFCGRRTTSLPNFSTILPTILDTLPAPSKSEVAKATFLSRKSFNRLCISMETTDGTPSKEYACSPWYQITDGVIARVWVGGDGDELVGSTGG